MSVQTTSAPVEKPPASEVGVVGWLRANLFNSPFNSVLTIACIALIIFILQAVLPWAVFKAVWSGTPKEFVQHLRPLVDSKKLFINESCDRTPLVNALHEIFQISTVERGTKGKKVISLDSLQTYFKKEASGDVY